MHESRQTAQRRGAEDGGQVPTAARILMTLLDATLSLVKSITPRMQFTQISEASTPPHPASWPLSRPPLSGSRS
jgi:hypothetical protein